MKSKNKFTIQTIVFVLIVLTLFFSYDNANPMDMIKVGESVGVVYSVKIMKTNEEVFKEYPSNGGAFNEIHRYYGSCDVFGDIAAACYDAGYSGKTSLDISRKLAIKYWVLAQGQVDICNMMYHTASYDKYMGNPSENLKELTQKVRDTCNISIDNINKERFNRDYTNNSNQTSKK